jgi:hypothetical protein
MSFIITSHYDYYYTTDFANLGSPKLIAFSFAVLPQITIITFVV